ncbi:MAG TPA: winged helix-turn-helix domain-containing protein [Ktedonobacteraceae bacterium]
MNPKNNPFTRPAFWGRQNELQAICHYLLSEPPQCCAIIGETSMGKTSLLRAFIDPQSPSIVESFRVKEKFTFVFLDCIAYRTIANKGEYAAAQFWWELYSETVAKLRLTEDDRLAKPEIGEDLTPLDAAFELKSALVDILREVERPVVFLFDNFEGIAHLPQHTSEWLRSLNQYNCTYVVSSRHLLYLLYQYHPESMVSPSPFYNIFSDPIYLGLMAGDEVDAFLHQAQEKARELGSCWEQKDVEFIQKMAGRHPELLRIACAHIFERCLNYAQSLTVDEQEFLEFSIFREAYSVCNILWRGLADPELSDVPGIVNSSIEKEKQELSPYQKALIKVANNESVAEKRMLFLLEQRGLIERVDGTWRVFGELMRKFVLQQEYIYTQKAQPAITPNARAETLTGDVNQISETGHVHRDGEATQGFAQKEVSAESRAEPVFTHLEGRVYNYLKAHMGEVCSKEQIKAAVWENDVPGDSALQKIIERIRSKIETDPDNPRYLIAKKRQGFMLREDPFTANVI